MAAPELKNIEIGNDLDETKELSLIRDLTVDAFDVDKNTENNMDELKTALKSTTINVITSTPGAATKTTEAKTLWTIATEFDTYVEQGEGWKLKLKEKDATGTALVAPEWIKYIIENPQNNDLAYFVQKLAGLIEYQTAKAYTTTELTAVEVWVDKAFGNQTKRALAGLKNWIESDATSVEKTTFLKKSTISDLITANTKSWTIDKTTLNTALASYHLVFDDDKRVNPATWYGFIDPNSTNYAVKLLGTWDIVTGIDKKEVAVNTVQTKIDAYIAATTEVAKAAILTELETYLKKTYTTYTADAFHKNFATALLTKKESFVWNGKVYYPILATDWTIIITSSTDEAKTKKEEVKKTEKETARKEKATIYSEKIFPATAKIEQAGDVFYITIPEADQITALKDIWKIPFSSKENAEKFIVLSKKYIQTYWYWGTNTGILYMIGKNAYLTAIEDLIADDDKSNRWALSFFKNSLIKSKLWSAIDKLDCWTTA